MKKKNINNNEKTISPFLFSARLTLPTVGNLHFPFDSWVTWPRLQFGRVVFQMINCSEMHLNNNTAEEKKDFEMKTLNSDHTLHCAHKNCTVISWCVSFECVEASNTEKAKFVGSNKIQRIASRSWLLRAQAVYSSDPQQTLNWMHLIDFTGFCHIQHDGIKSRFILLFTATDLLEDKSAFAFNFRRNTFAFISVLLFLQRNSEWTRT